MIQYYDPETYKAKSSIGYLVRRAGNLMTGRVEAAFAEHEITFAHLGKGVRGALKGVDRSYAQGFLELFQKDGAGNLFYVERESLAEEGVSQSELAEGFGIASRDELREKMLDSDAVFSF